MLSDQCLCAGVDSQQALGILPQNLIEASLCQSQTLERVHHILDFDTRVI